MAYQIDGTTGDIVINGFQNGIGSSPESGLTDMRSVNPISITGEASVSFSTAPVFLTPVITNNTQGSFSTTSGGLFLAPTSLKLEQGQYITFSSIGTATGTVAINTPYFLSHYGTSGANEEYQLITVANVAATVTTASASATFSTINPSGFNYIQTSKANNFAVDTNGRVWSDYVLTSGGGSVTATHSWSYLGNDPDALSVGTANGNGLLVFTTVHAGGGGSSTPATFDEWLFVWRNSSIDYTQLTSPTGYTGISWVYGWNYKLGTTGQTAYLNTNLSTPNPHPALVTPDGRANFCDGNVLGNWYQNVPALGTGYTAFNPATIATYTPQTITALLAAADIGQSLAFVNDLLLVGGRGNIIYPWNIQVTSNTWSNPLILLPETNIAAIVTVGNNAYIFAGNRGNIYITNGSQASFYKKVPDHISGAVEPLFDWGNGIMTAQCAAYQKNRIYFGCNANLQAGGNASGYGGLWCIDLVANQGQGVLFNSQQMSYGTYAGFVSCVSMSASSTAAGNSYGQNIGYGLIAGWSDASGSNYGIDVDISKPYTGGQSWVTSELIPVGDFLSRTSPTQVEYKLSTPMVSGESLQIKIGYYLDMTYASFISAGTFSYSSDPSVNNISGNSEGFPVQNVNNIQGQQWLLVQCILTSTATNPSYTRLTELRIMDASKKITSMQGLE